MLHHIGLLSKGHVLEVASKGMLLNRKGLGTAECSWGGDGHEAQSACTLPGLRARAKWGGRTELQCPVSTLGHSLRVVAYLSCVAPLWPLILQTSLRGIVGRRGLRPPPLARRLLEGSYSLTRRIASTPRLHSGVAASFDPTSEPHPHTHLAHDSAPIKEYGRLAKVIVCSSTCMCVSVNFG